MAKKKKSKLDQFAQPLADMDAQAKTLDEMLAWLGEEGVICSHSTLSDFLSAQRQSRLQASLLAQIASGARQCKDVDAAFAKHPAPGLETLIGLFKVLIMQLTTVGASDPEMLKLADQLSRTALEFINGQTKARFKERELTLAEAKFHFDAAKKCLEKLPELKEVSNRPRLTDEEKAKAIQQILFPRS